MSFIVNTNVKPYMANFYKLKNAYPAGISGKFKVEYGFIQAKGLSTHGPGFLLTAKGICKADDGRIVKSMQYSPQSEYLYVYGENYSVGGSLTLSNFDIFTEPESEPEPEADPKPEPEAEPKPESEPEPEPEAEPKSEPEAEPKPEPEPESQNRWHIGWDKEINLTTKQINRLDDYYEGDIKAYVRESEYFALASSKCW